MIVHTGCSCSPPPSIDTVVGESPVLPCISYTRRVTGLVSLGHMEQFNTGDNGDYERLMRVVVLSILIKFS